MGAIYDPMMDEMWTAERGSDALLNGLARSRSKPPRRIARGIVTCGFPEPKIDRQPASPASPRIAYAVRKTRMLGSAAPRHSIHRLR
ncbi:MAG: hypothetical protein R3F11_06665 [Verrucomicrobiales bacterium]